MARSLKQYSCINGNPSSGFDDKRIDNIKAIQIGIQAPMGTQFRINNSPIITMGKTGIFEWNVEGTGTEITSFEFVSNFGDGTYIVDLYGDDVDE